MTNAARGEGRKVSVETTVGAMNGDWPLNPRVSLEDADVVTNREEWRQLLRGGASPFHFEPSEGRKGHIERGSD